MSATHEKLPKLFWVQLLLVAIVAALYFYYSGSADKHDEAATEPNPKVHAAAKNLKPVGKVALRSNTESSGDNKARSGKQVYDAACFACHNTGVANAPKPDDKAAWEPRVAQGLESLLKTAINGKGAMPPRGGNPAVTDEELKNAIIYMTTKAGFDVASAADNKNDTSPKTAAIETAKTDLKPVTVPQQSTQTTAPATPSSVEPPQPVTAPVPPTPPTPPATAVTTTTPSKPVMEKVAAVTAPAIVAATAAANNNASLKRGEKIYKKTCFACHATGVANAPKLEDKANWAPRLASGKEALYQSALKGKGVMPPKGGNMDLADDVVKAAVDYMVSQAQ